MPGSMEDATFEHCYGDKWMPSRQTDGEIILSSGGLVWCSSMSHWVAGVGVGARGGPAETQSEKRGDKDHAPGSDHCHLLAKK